MLGAQAQSSGTLGFDRAGLERQWEGQRQASSVARSVVSLETYSQPSKEPAQREHPQPFGADDGGSPFGSRRGPKPKLAWLGKEDVEVRSPKQITAERNAAAKAIHRGPKTLEELLRFLQRRYATLLRAWRLALDVDGNGFLTYNEFVPKVRKMGYVGSIRQLFADLDPEGTGYVTLAALAPDAADQLDDFRSMLLEKFETSQEAWRALSRKGQGYLSVGPFVEGCQALGWAGDARQMHRMLDSHVHPTGTVGIIDLEWLGLPSRPRHLDDQDHRTKTKDVAKANLEKQKGMKNMDEFKALLKSRYGSVLRAWRLVLDPDGNGTLTYPEFGPRLRGLGYQGSLRELWDTLDFEKQGSITLHELSPKTAEQLDAFRTLLVDRYETTEDAWRELATRGQAVLSADQFASGCAKLGYEGDGALMHRMLDRRGTGRVSHLDLEWLGMPTRLAHDDQRVKEEKDKVKEQVKLKRRGPKTVDEFKNFCRSKFGNIVRAWRLALNHSGSGTLTYTDFGPRLRALGYEGSIRDLWAELDGEGKGCITLSVLAPQMADQLDDFRSLLQENFRTAEGAWKAFARGRTSLTAEQFSEAVGRLGWEEVGDPRLLHRMLDSERHGGKVVTIADLEWVGAVRLGTET